MTITVKLFSFVVLLQNSPGVPVTEPATNLGLKTSEWIMIAAIIAGPIFAVLSQLGWQRWKEKRDKKAWVFNTLMSLRAQPLTPDYVRALNHIDVVFYKNGKVRQRWKALLEHFYSEAYNREVVEQATIDRGRDLAAELMAEMAKVLGYQYDHTHIKENAYIPKLFVFYETQGLQLLVKGAAVLEGKSSIRVKLEE
jgi:hypothetical protein